MYQLFVSILNKVFGKLRFNDSKFFVVLFLFTALNTATGQTYCDVQIESAFEKPLNDFSEEALKNLSIDSHNVVILELLEQGALDSAFEVVKSIPDLNCENIDIKDSISFYMNSNTFDRYNVFLLAKAYLEKEAVFFQSHVLENEQ